ncbi:hypothetical protein MHTCC0001_15950 [Flavobacteriaceae bacterium MHTCC 0001]
MNKQNQKFYEEMEDLRSKMHLMSEAEFNNRMEDLQNRIKSYIIDGVEVDYEEVRILKSIKGIVNS